MAVQTTEEFKNGGATSYAITIEYLKASDIKVRIDGTLQTYVASSPGSGQYTVSGTTVTLGAQAASGTGNVHIYRETDVDTAAAVFVAGSSIKAADLNAIHDMARLGLSEARSTTIESDIKDGAITSAKIKDGTIVNADVNASAAIDGSKIQASSGSNSGTMSSANFTKLAGIETGATADQTAAEIKTLVGNATDSNVFTDADHSKLDGIEAGATADQTNAEIRAAVEAATDSNVFTDADHTKLNNIETGATADQTGAEIKSAYEGESNTNAFTDAEKTKLGNLGSLNALSDVNTSGVADGKILKYDASSSAFIIADDGGSGSGGSSTFTGLSDTPANYGSAANKTLKVNSSGNAIEFVDVSTDIVSDTTPQLGGSLDVQGFSITTGNINGDINLTPNGTGVVEIRGNTANNSANVGTLQLNCQNNSHGVKIQSPPHSAGASYTLTLPNTAGNNGQFLKTNGSGVLSWAADNNQTLTFPNGATGLSLSTQNEIQINDANHKIVFDTDTTNTHEISFASPSSLTKTSAFTLPEDGSNGQFLKTDGSGNLSFATVDLTNLSASNLTSGTIPDARFPATLPAVSGANLTNLPQSPYNISINTLSSSSGSGGGSATFNGSATRFTLSNAGTNAQAHIVSVNGVIQKPNSGTSPSEGFAIDGNDIIFASAPASGADFFILTIGNTIGVGTPSDNTVTAAKITSGAVEQAKVAGEAINESKLQVSNAPTNGYYLQAQSGNAGGMTWAEVEAGAKHDIFWENGQTVSSNYTITNGKNAMSAGPITINNGIAVTIGTGENWTIV